MSNVDSDLFYNLIKNFILDRNQVTDLLKFYCTVMGYHSIYKTISNRFIIVKYPGKSEHHRSLINPGESNLLLNAKYLRSSLSAHH